MNSRRFVDGNALSTASAINATAPSLHRKDIDRAALRHLGILARKQQIHARLHRGARWGVRRQIWICNFSDGEQTRTVGGNGVAAAPDKIDPYWRRGYEMRPGIEALADMLH